MKQQYPESDFQQLSSLQHLAYCPRQWGLIHLEGCWQAINKNSLQENTRSLV